MRAIDRASGYFQSFDPKSGARIEGETRMCVHCGYQWVRDVKNYLTSKGLRSPKTTRGTCMHCHGLVCARDECLKRGCVPLMKQIEEMESPSKILRLA